MDTFLERLADIGAIKVIGRQDVLAAMRVGDNGNQEAASGVVRDKAEEGVAFVEEN